VLTCRQTAKDEDYISAQNYATVLSNTYTVLNGQNDLNTCG